VIKSAQYGHLTVGAGADVAVLRLDNGKFGFLDQRNGLTNGTQRLACELTLLDGNVVWDLNGLMGEPWETQPPPAPRTRPAAAQR
jgi:dihydroorotase